MNDLYFFFKISRKKPCSHLPAARKAVFCLFFRLKGLAFRPFVFLLPGPFRHNLLPEASVFGTKAHPVSQLYRTAAAPHKAAQQLHIFFLCVTHGSRQRVHGCFQNKRIRSGKRAQPPHRTGFRAVDGSLCRIQTCSRKQLFGLPGKIGIRAGCLLAEAGKVFRRCAVGALQRRQRRTAHPVAGIGIGRVRLICDPCLPGCTAEAFGILPGKSQQWPQVAPALWPDACRTVQPRAPGQPQQQGLSLIICSMGRCNDIYPLPAQTRKAGIAQAARPVLPGMFRRQAHFVGHLCSMEHPQRHTQPGAFRPHKGFVPVSALTAQAVVHMAGRKHKPEFRLQGQQDAQQCHAVRPAGHCCSQVQRLTRTKQLFSQNKHAHMRQNFFIVHQRLKSTSIKRVWAPSQPSGTVLVSP